KRKPMNPGRISVCCGAHGRLVARASRPFAPNQKLTGGTPVPLALQERGTHDRAGRFVPADRAPSGSGRWKAELSAVLSGGQADRTLSKQILRVRCPLVG